MMDWFRLDPKVTKLSQYLDGEPIAFVKILQEDYEARTKKYSMSSIAGKSIWNMYDKITAWLNEATKSDSQKAAEAELENNIEELVSKLSSELADFKVRYLEKVHEAAGKRYERIPTDIEALKNQRLAIEARYDAARKEKKGYNATWKIWSEKEKVDNKIGRLNGILRMYPTVEEFQKFTVEEATKQFEYNVRGLADRLLDKKFIIEKITVSNVKNDPKFFEMTITDGEKKLYCRSVLAAQFSEKMIPHFRFIMTERN
jgi:chromosome segregation ATPase